MAARRDLTLGASVAEFMRRIGLELDTGGPTGSLTRLRAQMMRLFRARVVLLHRSAGRWSPPG